MVWVLGCDCHEREWKRRGGEGSAGDNSAPIVIGDDVFIGANVIILKGTKIGERSVIGAGSVVALKDISPDSLVVGNPARVVRSLRETWPHKAAGHSPEARGQPSLNFCLQTSRDPVATKHKCAE